MAVESFLQPSESKQTVEKPVKQKPSITELTTIEFPGKPVPANYLESSPPKKVYKRKKVSKSPLIKISKPIKDSILIVTEKPQAAQKIAQALSPSPRKVTSPNKVSYYELSRNGKTILVASAVGHLFGLTYVKGQKGWPIFKIEWEPAYNKKSAAFTKNYLEVLQKLARKAEEIIIATDYDIEGEVIGWNVLRFICGRETAKRMKYSTLTKNELVQAYENPMPQPDWGQAYAGETRHILDWLYGINLSRALMSAIKTAGSFKILSIGRVQGPALKIIVDREHEIAKFKPEPFWQVLALIKKNGGASEQVRERKFELITSGLASNERSESELNKTPAAKNGRPIIKQERLQTAPISAAKDIFYIFKHPKDIFDKSQLEKFKDIKEGTAETKESEESPQPPVPFDLTTLQREAYRLHKISPSSTLASAQKLYLDGLISYPRTSSQKIPESIQPKSILKSLEKNFSELTKLAARSHPIEGKKDDPAHPSIYPTGETPSKKLQDYEEKLYNIIARRFIAAFCPDAITQNKRVKITAKTNQDISASNNQNLRAGILDDKVIDLTREQSEQREDFGLSGRASALRSSESNKNNERDRELGGSRNITKQKEEITFTASGLKIKDKGWTKVYPAVLEESDCPTLNGEVKIDEIKFVEKETQPPKRFTPTSLITILEKKNLGTKATRSSIVDTLFDRGYLDGRSIQATALGMRLIESLEKYSPIIIDENLTRQMEEETEKILALKSNFKEQEDKVIHKAEKIITDISKEFKTKEHEIGKEIIKGIEIQRETERENNTLRECPTCKKGNLRITFSPKIRRYFIGCSSYPECRQTYNVPPNALIKKSDKLCEECGWQKLMAIRKGKRPWDFCYNLDCPEVKKRLEEYRARKEKWNSKQEENKEN